jgi:hypothetical protein
LFPGFCFIRRGGSDLQGTAFEGIGSTTHGIAMPGAMDENMLAVMTLTSDDVFFSAGVSGPLDTDGEKRVQELYERLSGDREFSPTFLTSRAGSKLSGNKEPGGCMKRYSKEDKAWLVQEWKMSGKSKWVFARKLGLGSQTFSK